MNFVLFVVEIMRKDFLFTLVLISSYGGFINGGETNFKREYNFENDRERKLQKAATRFLVPSGRFVYCNVNMSDAVFSLSSVCRPKDFISKRSILKVNKEKCQGCEALANCTTLEGSIQIQMVRKASDAVMKQLRFPKLTEITGHLLVSLVYSQRSLKEIFPNLAVIRGRELYLDYSLVIYENDGLEEVNLPSLTTILRGGVRIEKNINLCYVKTVRWKSIMRNTKVDEYTLVLNSNNNACYDRCFQTGTRKCTPPGGHGSLTNQYCWAPGDKQNADCQACKYERFYYY